MAKNRSAFLFGAGAMMEWNGPSTSELTRITRETGFTIKDSDQKVTDYIFQKLKEKGFDSEDTNFETIINVIEELSVYYSEFNSKKETPSVLRAFLDDSHLEEIFDYAIKGGQRKHGYELKISNSTFPSNKSLDNETPTQFYLQHLLSEILTNISDRISKYAYHTDGHSVIQKDSQISLDFRNWMSSMENSDVLRLYTLNYDRIFKILLLEQGIDCFEGFYPSGNTSDFAGLRCDVPKIVEDMESHIYYNLHGSAFWKVVKYNRLNLLHPEISFNGVPNLQVNNLVSTLQIERGKSLFLTNIITGYQKAQKSMISPFKQMQAAFDRDCLKADKLFIIGYSFGDEHINESIKIALRHNTNLKLEIVDPGFYTNNIHHRIYLTLFQYIENKDPKPTQLAENIDSYFEGQVLIYTLRFSQYLEVKTCTRI